MTICLATTKNCTSSLNARLAPRVAVGREVESHLHEDRACDPQHASRRPIPFAHLLGASHLDVREVHAVGRALHVDHARPAHPRRQGVQDRVGPAAPQRVASTQHSLLARATSRTWCAVHVGQSGSPGAAQRLVLGRTLTTAWQRGRASSITCTTVLLDSERSTSKLTPSGHLSYSYACPSQAIAQHEQLRGTRCTSVASHESHAAQRQASVCACVSVME